MFHFKSYARAGSIQEAIRLLRENPEARLIAGGTDLLVKLHKGKAQFDHLVDIHDIAELNFITQSDDGDIVIGPLTCFTRVAESSLIRKHIPVLSEAILTIGGPQVRNMATIGGNLCNGVPSADSATPLIAFLGPSRVALKQHEILTAITVTRDNYADYFGHFYKYAMRDAMDIATIGCSAVCKLQDDILKDLRLAYGVAARCPSAASAPKTKSVAVRFPKSCSLIFLRLSLMTSTHEHRGGQPRTFVYRLSKRLPNGLSNRLF
jgi:xanthine dehydrogenase FAD-binding subunit